MTCVITPDQVAVRVRDLPPLPAILMDLIGSLGSDSISSEMLASKLSQDLGLSAKTLRMANSSFFGMTRQIDSIPDALAVLGLRAVRTLVLAAGLMGTLKQAQGVGFDFRVFWRHAIGAGLCGRLLAREVGMDSEIGFTVGLLHDIGTLALVHLFPDQYERTLACQKQNDLLLIDAERATLGTDHAQVGAMLLERWHFSPVIVEAIAHHHAPAMHHGPGLVGLAHLADAFSHAMALSGQDDEVVPPTSVEIWNAMAPSSEKCLALLSEVEDQFDDVCQALQV
jgi:putative nucleotidyltransferase with HDIG domain